MKTKELETKSVEQLMDEVWNSMFGMEIVSVTREMALEGGEDFLTAWIKIIGSAEVMVVLKCSTHLTRKSAAIMFDMAETQVGPEEEREGLKELVNIVGGNI